MGAQRVRDHLGHALQNLRSLTGLQSLSRFENESEQARLEVLSKHLLAFAGWRDSYRRIRLFDAKGEERVRIDFNKGKGTVISDQALKRDRDRRFFSDVFRLNAGQVFISPFELERKNRKIVHPYRLQIHIGAPMFDGAGRKKGALIITLAGEAIINTFLDGLGESARYAMVLNRGGYWLHSPDPRELWGFQLDHGGSFRQKYPEAWRKIITSDRGQFYQELGLFTFRTIHPLDNRLSPPHRGGDVDARPTSNGDGKYFWKLITFVPQSALEARVAGIKWKLLWLFVPIVMLVFGGAVAIATAMAKRREFELRLKEANENLEQNIEKRTRTLEAEIESRIRAETALRESSGLIDLQQSVAAAANVSETPQEALLICLRDIAAYCGCPVAHAYMVHEDAPDLLKPSDLWVNQHPRRYGEFTRLTMATGLCRGEGLAGRVLATAEPVWVTKIRDELDVPRARVAVGLGLKSAFAFPVLAGRDVVAVLEFFSSDEMEQDAGLFYMLLDIGGQLGRVFERRRAQDALSKVGASLANSQRIAQLGNWEWSVDSGAVWASAEFCRIFGVESESRVLLTDIVKAISENDHDRFLKTLDDSRHGCEDHEIECTIVRRDGQRRYLRFLINAECVANRAVKIILIVQDITDHEADRQLLRKLSLAVEQSPASVVISDVNGVIEYVNRRFCDTTGYRPDEILGKNPTEGASGEISSGAYLKLWEKMETGETWSGEVLNRRKNGEEYWEYSSISPIKDEHGLITNFLAIMEDISVRKKYEEQLLHRANYDDLTDLPNRVLSLDRLTQSIERAKRDDGTGAVFFVDLDDFKSINDTKGHDVGDRILIEVGRRLQGCVRKVDTVARMGGDEFEIIIEAQKSSVMIEQAARDIIDAFTVPFHIDRYEFFISASVGITLFPSDGDDPQVLRSHADAALFRAKDLGRNNYQFFTAEMNEKTARRVRLETALRYALERNELSINYQPIVDIQTRRPIGAEALLRWNNPQMGAIGPDTFIPIAESTGLIVPIGAWVMNKACRDAELWRKQTGRDLFVAVNTSSRQYRDGAMADTINTALAQSKLPPDCLEVEITESLLIEGGNVSSELDRLKALGVKLSIDDFGTGYSSLSYLKRFPLDTLKVDKSFVNDVTVDKEDAELVRAIIAMAHSLELCVIAEGVETEDQLDFFAKEGGDLIQGFYYSRPLPLDKFMDYLKAFD
ncbi:EAL domain-containing protein [Varunaivibrio sulfuroxidans]|nr:EAL domain-containing protein [Varunaivibrio sulfuroxidans]WES30696.1 EAL domain-containing protein [Varunaivibrio sulfuroxidans]